LIGGPQLCPLNTKVLPYVNHKVILKITFI